MNPLYTTHSHVYDLLHAQLTEDIAFVLPYATEANGPILELGCGSGRLLLPLAKAGSVVTGLDNAQRMLDSAESKLSQHNLKADLVSADMTNFTLAQKQFALAIISYNTLTHLTQAQIGSMLKSLSQHVVDGARLIIDTVNPFMLAAIEDQPAYESEGSVSNGDLTVEQAARYTHHAHEQRVSIEWQYAIQQNNATETIDAKTDHNYHYPHLLQMLLQNHGFSWEAVYGDYDLSEFDEGSERLLIVAQKV